MLVKNFVIKVIAPVYLGAIILASCNTPAKNVTYPKAVRLISHLQIINNKGHLINHIDSLTIYYYQDIVLYKIPVMQDFSKVTLDRDYNIIEEKFLRMEIIFDYFIYRKGDSYMFKYDSSQTFLEEKFLIDSFLNVRFSSPAGVFNYMPDSLQVNGSLIKTIKDRNNNSMLEKYINNTKYNEGYSDTTYLYYKHGFKNIDYTFSKRLDSIKKMKLFKIRFIYNSFSDPKYPYNIPARENWFQLEEIPVADSNFIISIIQKFEKLQH